MKSVNVREKDQSHVRRVRADLVLDLFRFAPARGGHMSMCVHVSSVSSCVLHACIVRLTPDTLK